jgi:hypothetical protein
MGRRRKIKDKRFRAPKTAASVHGDWIHTKIASIYLPAADYITDRAALPVRAFEAQRAALRGTAHSIDLTCRKRARGLVSAGKMVFIV